MGTTDVAAGHEEEEHEHTSVWPLVAAIGAAALYGGGGLALVGLDLVPMPLAAAMGGVGVLLFVVGLAGWTYEAFIVDYWAEDAGERAQLYRWGMLLFLFSDVATFSAGFIYYAFVRVGPWPPGEVPHIFGSLVLINTGLLIASSFTIHYSHHYLQEGDRTKFLGLLGATFLLGVVFLGGQVLEYYELLVHEGFSLESGVFASAFYGLTGLHGLHVALGVVLIGITLGRGLRGQYVQGRDTAVSTVSLYWHFVDVVWVFLVVVVYVFA